MFHITITDHGAGRTIESAGPIGTYEEIRNFVSNHTNMPDHIQDAFAKRLLEHGEASAEMGMTEGKEVVVQGETSG